MRLVDDWRNWWKMYSVHALAFLGALGALSDWLPIVREFVPAWVYIAIMVAGIGGRLINQWWNHAEQQDDGKG